VLAARREPELRRVADEIGGDTLVVRADVTVRAQVEQVRDAALERFGHVDVWVNNAGRGIDRHVLDLTDDDVDEMMTVNVKSALYGMQAIVPHFRERERGHLINVSSFLGRVPGAPQRSAYSAAKAYLNSLTTNLRMDLAADHPGIHVSTVMPGIVATDFARNALGAPPSAPGSGTMQPQPVEEAAARIVHLIEHPAPEIYTNPILPAMAKRVFDQVGAFDPLPEVGAS
ncbi:MAG TPA: SDR family oxidoreductase, partial [Longimicrobiaceae bacterium]|nr:SDR family oxidoreductase [Longimicrobiaceae bacterium]